MSVPLPAVSPMRFLYASSRGHEDDRPAHGIAPITTRGGLCPAAHHPPAPRPDRSSYAPRLPSRGVGGTERSCLHDISASDSPASPSGKPPALQTPRFISSARWRNGGDGLISLQVFEDRDHGLASIVQILPPHRAMRERWLIPQSSAAEPAVAPHSSGVFHRRIMSP